MGSFNNSRQFSANVSGVSAIRISWGGWMPRPSAPIVVETTGVRAANASEIFKRVPPHAERNNGNGGAPQIRADIRNGPGDLQLGIVLRALSKADWRLAADDGDGAIRFSAPDQRQDLVEKLLDAIDVRHPIHRTDEH
jgi:hypothetical protein